MNPHSCDGGSHWLRSGLRWTLPPPDPMVFSCEFGLLDSLCICRYRAYADAALQPEPHLRGRYSYVNAFTIFPAGREVACVALTWSRNIEWDIDDWRDEAACRDTDPDLFFPVGTTGPAIEQIDAAKAVCTQCDAQQSCLEFAFW